jgi:hypothetical protein
VSVAAVVMSVSVAGVNCGDPFTFGILDRLLFLFQRGSSRCCEIWDSTAVSLLDMLHTSGLSVSANQCRRRQIRA